MWQFIKKSVFMTKVGSRGGADGSGTGLKAGMLRNFSLT